jgi:hypothetical protein
MVPVNQQPFTQQHPPMQSQFNVQSPYQQGYSSSPVGALAPQQQWQQWSGAAPVVSEVTLRVVSAALATVIEQMRSDPQALQTLCAQGQLTPQAYSNVLVESARRSAPAVAGAIAPGMGQHITGSFGPQQYPLQPSIGQQHSWQGQQNGWQTPIGQPFGPSYQSPLSYFG